LTRVVKSLENFGSEASGRSDWKEKDVEERVSRGDKEEGKGGKGRLLWKAAEAKDFRLTSKKIVVASES
jgi:hypothetical protein